MDKERLTEFTGIAGAVLRRSISGGSLVSGLVLGFVLFLGNWALMAGGAGRLAAPFSQVIVALALARFAVNGLFGEWGGTVFSAVGGPWPVVGAVAARYLALTGLWLLPVMLIGTGAPQIMPGNPGMMLSMMGPMLAFASVYLLVATLTPPVFLIVSVAATGFGDVFSPQHWRQQFSGRLGDLFSIYVVYTGGLAMVLLLGLPVVMLGFSASPKLGFVLGALAFVMLFGVALNLLGRLCGFFACGDVGLGEPAGAVPVSSGSPPATPPAEPVVTPPVIPVSSGPAVPTVPVTAQASARPATGPSQAPAGAPPRQTTLLDAEPRVAAERNRFAHEPEEAILALEKLRRDYLPHPLVLHALATCLHRTGKMERALEAANQAIPLCIERGQAPVAAELFKMMRADLERLSLEPDALIAIGGALARSADWAAAAKAYSVILMADAENVRAIKGMLKVAEGILASNAKPEAAAKIYRFLAKHCAASPLSEYIQSGLAEAERLLAPSA